MKKEEFLNAIEDAVADLFYYDRKDDEDLNLKDLNKLLESGEITLEEIVKTFENEIIKNFPYLKK